MNEDPQAETFILLLSLLLVACGFSNVLVEIPLCGSF